MELLIIDQLMCPSLTYVNWGTLSLSLSLSPRLPFLKGATIYKLATLHCRWPIYSVYTVKRDPVKKKLFYIISDTAYILIWIKDTFKQRFRTRRPARSNAVFTRTGSSFLSCQFRSLFPMDSKLSKFMFTDLLLCSYIIALIEFTMDYVVPVPFPI